MIRHGRRKQRGGVFITTLILMTGLVSVVVAVAAANQVTFKARLNRIEQMKAERLVQAGVARAMAELSLITTQSPTTTQDDWALLGTTGLDRFVVGDGSFRIEILDASGRVDLNTATEDQLNNLPLTTEQVESLLDWRSAGNAPRPEGGKDDYYNNLPTPYNTSLQNLETVDELLLIKGFTAQTLYQPQEGSTTNQSLVQGSIDTQPLLIDLVMVGAKSVAPSTNGQPLQNIQTATLQQLNAVLQNLPLAAQMFAQRATFTSMGAVLRFNGLTTQSATRLLNSFTAGTATEYTGRLNINTAPEAVLNTLPGLTPDITQAIIERQESGIQSLGDLLSIPGMSLQILQQIIDLININSQTYLIRVIGTYGTTEIAKEVVVTITTNGIKTIHSSLAYGSDYLTRWGWAAETSNEIILAEAE